MFRSEPDLTPGAKYFYSDRIMAAQALNHWKECLRLWAEIEGRPHHEWYAGAGRVSTEVKSWGNPLIGFTIAGYPRVWHRRVVNELDWTLARVSVAVAWYQAEKGKYPQSLADLVPTYLNLVPRDPFTGLSLGYRVEKKEARVYSFGQNRSDDGGKFADYLDYDEDEDITWIIKRRSP